MNVLMIFDQKEIPKNWLKVVGNGIFYFFKERVNV